MDSNLLHPLKAEFMFTINEKSRFDKSIDCILLVLLSIS